MRDPREAKVAEAVFTKTLKSKNFMTPTVLRYGISNGYAYELSTGTGMDNQQIWGVTCINAMLGTRQIDLDQMFHSIDEAEEHIKTLGDK